MNKKIFGFLAVIVIAALAAWNVSLISKNNSLSDISLKGIDSHANIIEDIGNWWDSLDYDCLPVTCQAILFTYKSKVADYKGTGLGTVAHIWSCVRCGDYGWTVD